MFPNFDLQYQIKPNTFLWSFSETFGLAYIITNSAKLNSSSEVNLTYNYQVTLSKEARSKIQVRTSFDSRGF